MNIIKKITLVFFILAVPILLFTASISVAANFPPLYKYGFARYDISQVTGIENSELNKVAGDIIHYWNSGDKEINITVIKNGQPFTLFNEREVSHMMDVKALFRLAYKFLLGSFIYFLIFLGLTVFVWKDIKLLTTGLIWGSGLSLVLMAAIAVASVIDFNWLFTQFHLLSFTNDLWLLNPYTDYLIMLFPEGFWFDAAFFVVGLIVLLALVMGFVGIRLKRKNAS